MDRIYQKGTKITHGISGPGIEEKSERKEENSGA
jgi:hypothetical protein